jgi:hypothetical protein
VIELPTSRHTCRKKMVVVILRYVMRLPQPQPYTLDMVEQETFESGTVGLKLAIICVYTIGHQ